MSDAAKSPAWFQAVIARKWIGFWWLAFIWSVGTWAARKQRLLTDCPFTMLPGRTALLLSQQEGSIPNSASLALSLKLAEWAVHWDGSLKCYISDLVGRWEFLQIKEIQQKEGCRTGLHRQISFSFYSGSSKKPESRADILFLDMQACA